MWLSSAITFVLILGSTAVPTSTAVAQTEGSHRAIEESEPVAHGISPALGSMRPATTGSDRWQTPNPEIPPSSTGTRTLAPGARQGPARVKGSGAQAPTATRNFGGLGEGFTGPQGTFAVRTMPPDPNGDVGPNHYVQVVNMSLAVFDKTGTVLYGPVPINTLWRGFGGLCELNSDGDPIVVYDALADRWVISQFAVQSGGPDFQCVAVSTTGDPLGTYALYAYSYEQLNDYPKIAVWPDGYYVTYNMFGSSGGVLLGAKTCVLDRSKMLANLPANQQCVDLDGSSYLPSDLDGQALPPAGSPNYILGISPTTFDQLDMYRFHVDWANPAQSDLAGPFPVPVAPFTDACATSGSRRGCIPQARTDQRLASLSGRVMYRLGYRNYGTHESLAANISIAATDDPDGQTATRWFEIRSPGANSPVVHQQGTYVPDGAYRWMGSIAMDRDQNMAMGYSKSSTTDSPTIEYTGRLATDPLGTMRPERTVELPSVGSQTGAPQDAAVRWGDYTSMQVDPVDDCTFWYTNQYVPADGSYNWRTRIVSFKFPSCLVPQTITFTPPGPTPLTTGTVAVSATASSGLAVTFTSLTTDRCTVSAATATLLRSGTCTLQASQDGDQTYSTATPVVGSFEITKDPTPIPTPTPTPTARTTLKVKAKPSTTKLRAGRSTTVVKRVTSNGKKVLKAKCTVGTKRIKRVCDIRIKRNRIRVGNGARVVVTPSCSDNVSATVKVIAKKQGAPRRTWTRSWKVAKRPFVSCSARGTG